MKKERPAVLKGKTYVIKTGCGKLYISINGDDDDAPMEILARMGRSGGCVASQMEAIGRLCSTALAGGVEPQYLIKQLKGIRCPSPNEYDGIKINSCADAFAKALEWYLGIEAESNGTNLCPKCKVVLNKVKNNLVCPECNFTRSD